MLCALLCPRPQDCNMVYFVGMSSDLPDASPAFIMKPVPYVLAMPGALTLPPPPPPPEVRTWRCALLDGRRCYCLTTLPVLVARAHVLSYMRTLLCASCAHALPYMRT